MEARGYDLKTTGRAFLTAFGEDELTVRAGDLAFRFFLALFPLLLFITAAGALIADIAGVDDPSGEVVDAIGDTLPEDATSVIRGQIDGVVDSGAGPLLLIVGMLGSLWAASSGVGAAVKAINAMDEDAPARPFIKGTALALGITTIGGLAVIGLFAGAIVAQVYAEDIARALGVGGQYNLVVGLVQVPLMLVVLMAVVGVLYRIAPVTSHPFRDRLPGAVAFVILWAPFTLAFAFYVANFGNYNATYGAIGGAVILMFWIYYSSLLLLAGAELNAVLIGQRRAQAAVVAPGLIPHAAPRGTLSSPARRHEQRKRFGPSFLGIATFALALLAIRRALRR